MTDYRYKRENLHISYEKIYLYLTWHEQMIISMHLCHVGKNCGEFWCQDKSYHERNRWIIDGNYPTSLIITQFAT